MKPFLRSIKSSSNRIDSECEELKQLFAINDDRGDLFVGNALWFQFSAHSAWDSIEIDGVFHNRYDSLDNGQGIYPQQRDSPLLTRDGYFELSEKGLPLLKTATVTKEIAVDTHRANENRFLKAFHLMACKMHNKRMKSHNNYELAKSEVVALLNQITLNELLVLTGMGTADIFVNRPVKLLNESLEWNFAINRWAHAMMPNQIFGEDLFLQGNSIDVDLLALFTKEKGRVLNLGISPAMNGMTHIRGEHSIIERTIDRHIELNLPSFQDLAQAFNLPCKIKINDCPIWPGILKEAEEFGNGKLGPVGAVAVSTGIVQSLMWGKAKNEGLWHPKWKGAPVETIDIIDYAA